MDDDSSVSSHSSSYYEEYLLLKKQYDEVLESNSQMVLRLEEAKLMLFKNTKELQSQNSALMSENMNLRAQKEYLQQGLEKLGSLVGTLMEEMGIQRGSMDRQKGCMDVLVCLVKSLAENKDNNLTNPETEANSGEENGPFLNLSALRELDKQLRANTMGSYYLPAIEEENCGHVEEDDDKDDDPDTTRPTRQSAFSGQSQEVQPNIVKGNSKSQGRTVSKIGRRGSSIRMKKGSIENGKSPQGKNKMGDILPSLKIKVQCPQQTADNSAEMIKSTCDEENDQIQAPAILRMSNNMVASLEPSTSGLLEHIDSNHDGAEALNGERYNHRLGSISKNGARETISSYSGIDQDNPNIQKDVLEANKDMQALAPVMDVAQQTPNAIIMKNVAMSYQAGDVHDKVYLERFPKNGPSKVTSGSIQIETKTQSNHMVEKIEKSVCVVELVDLFRAAQSNHLHEVNMYPKTLTNTIALNQNLTTLGKTSNDKVPKLVEGRYQPSKETPKNGNHSSTKTLTAQSTAHCLIKDVAKKTSLNSHDRQANVSSRTVEVQPSCGIKVLVSKISQAKESLNGPIKPRAEESYSENMESKSLNYEDNNVSTIQETQPLCQATARVSGSSKAIDNTEPSNNKLADASCSEDKEFEQNILPKIQGDASTARRCVESQKVGECQDPSERERKTSSRNLRLSNMSSAQIRAPYISKDILMKTSPNCVDMKTIDVPIIQELSSEIKACEFQISQAQEHNDSSNEPTNTLMETPCLVNKENNPRKTRIIEGSENITEDETQRKLLSIVRKSKYSKTNNRSSRSNFLTPVQDPSTPVAKNESGREISFNLEVIPDEARMISRKNGNFVQRKSCFLSPSMEDFRVSTGRTLRESQMANSLLNEVRVSVASSQGDSCYGDFSTPRKGKRVRSNHTLRKNELVSLLSESAGFQGDLGSEVMKEKRIVTRSRSKPRRDKEVINNFSGTSENDEPNKDFKFKPPGRCPRRAAKK